MEGLLSTGPTPYSFTRFLILKVIIIAVLVLVIIMAVLVLVLVLVHWFKLQRFCGMGVSCLLVKLHRERSAPAACAAGLFFHEVFTKTNRFSSLVTKLLMKLFLKLFGTNSFFNRVFHTKFFSNAAETLQ